MIEPKLKPKSRNNSLGIVELMRFLTHRKIS